MFHVFGQKVHTYSKSGGKICNSCHSSFLDEISEFNNMLIIY